MNKVWDKIPDVLKIIKNEKLLNCHIVLSSRPHATKEVEKYFTTVVRIDGFTKAKAMEFVSKFFLERKKIKTNFDDLDLLIVARVFLFTKALFCFRSYVL